MLGVCVGWAVLLHGTVQSFRLTPHISGSPKIDTVPKVSIILPARNEEAFIGRCLHTLTKQDYPNYEIIVINDSSEDATGEIIRKYAAQDPRIIPVDAKSKPDNWMGKNWACIEGYERATGELLLFTDADTTFAPDIISKAVNRLISDNLDALTAIPRLLTNDPWTRATLPVLAAFLHTQFSALKVNDSKKTTGYFYGSFFVMRRETYEEVGTHKVVSQEIVEDAALGRIVKGSGYKMRMVRADDMVDAVWARDGPTLWNALKRLIVPVYLHDRKMALGILASGAFLMLLPFPLAAYSALAGTATSALALLGSSLAASLMILCGAVVETKILRIKIKHALACPVGGAIIVGGFLAGVIRAGGKNSVSWRNRNYTIKDHVQSRIM